MSDIFAGSLLISGAMLLNGGISYDAALLVIIGAVFLISGAFFGFSNVLKRKNNSNNNGE